jgi:ABC-2 type transport system permease protein
VRRVATFTPLFGLNALVHLPLVGGTFDWTWPANLLIWLALFVAGATWLFRRDTARV